MPAGSFEIPLEEVSFHYRSNGDAAGRVFSWNDKIYRAISVGAGGDHVREGFHTGFFEKLQRLQMIPQSELTSLRLLGFDGIVYHEEVESIAYPSEWTFEMLKDAALFVLNVIKNCAAEGWSLKDAHGFNLAFRNNAPIWLDLGSFIRIAPNDKRLPFPRNEFLASFYIPLQLWSQGHEYLARRLLVDDTGSLPSGSWNLALSDKRRTSGRPRNPGSLIAYLKGLVVDPHYRANSRITDDAHLSGQEWIDLTSQGVAKLSGPLGPSAWSTYHDEFSSESGGPQGIRAQRVLELVRSMGAETVVDIGANQGAFSLMLLSQSAAQKVIAIDSDSRALDKLYTHLKTTPSTDRRAAVTVVRQNAVMPDLSIDSEWSYDRFHGDVVLALAVTHHMILGAGLSMDFVIRRISQYTRSYAIIEFMPLGLWSGGPISSVPDYYSFAAFKEIFSKYFELMGHEKLEENRIIFWGRRR